MSVAISGTAQVGQTLTVSGGTGAIQWYHEGSPIAGATSMMYVIPASDISFIIGASMGGVFGLNTAPVKGANEYFVSFSTGLDTNPGTKAAPWKTLDKVNGFSFLPGTTISFKRGDTWRTQGNTVNSRGVQLHPKTSGSANNPIVFDAYGTGTTLPIFDGSYDASHTTDWVNVGTNLWRSAQTFPPSAGNTNGLPYYQANDVGNILWGFTAVGGTNVPVNLINASTGKMTGGGTGGVWYKPGDGLAHLTAQGDWNFNTDGANGTTQWTVQIYSTTNPATAMPGLSLAIDTANILIDKDYITIQNLDIRFGATGLIMASGGGTSNYTVVRDCVLQWGGGGNNGGASDFNSRNGDGVDMLGSSQGWLVERNWIYQTYDTGVGPQFGGAHGDNVTIRNNIVLPGNAAFNNLFGATMTNNGYYVYNNTVYGLDGGWSNNQRPNGVPNNAGIYPWVTSETNQVFNNNVFAHIKNFGIVGAGAWMNNNPFSGQTWLDYNCWPNRTSDNTAQVIALPSGPMACPINGNCVIGGTGNWGDSVTPKLEVHGVFADPKFTNGAAYNFYPASGSPLFNAGVNLYNNVPAGGMSPSGVVWGISRGRRPSTGNITIGAYQ
jgi:hypothetical protein